MEPILEVPLELSTFEVLDDINVCNYVPLNDCFSMVITVLSKAKSTKKL